MENNTITLVVERATFAFHTIKNMTSTKTAIRPLDTCAALNIKWMITTETLLREIFTTMMHPASFASSSHVVQCWWCQLGMTAHLDGSRSIMDTWWLLIITTSIQATSFVLMGIRSMSLVAMPTKTVPCCTLWKEIAAHSHGGRELTCAVCTKWWVVATSSTNELQKRY